MIEKTATRRNCRLFVFIFQFPRCKNISILRPFFHRFEKHNFDRYLHPLLNTGFGLFSHLHCPSLSYNILALTVYGFALESCTDRVYRHLLHSILHLSTRSVHPIVTHSPRDRASSFKHSHLHFETCTATIRCVHGGLATSNVP